MPFSIDVPSAQDRLDIINFYLKEPGQNDRLAFDVSMVNLKELVNATQNFTEADLSLIYESL